MAPNTGKDWDMDTDMNTDTDASRNKKHLDGLLMIRFTDIFHVNNKLTDFFCASRGFVTGRHFNCC